MGLAKSHTEENDDMKDGVAATRKERTGRQAASPAEARTEARGVPKWDWREGMVDVRGEHIELRYGDAAKSAYKQWLPIALIGKPADQVFPVLWLMSPDNPSHEEMIASARKELDFYLVENREPDPWAYAKYHCNTAANMYSDVHWSYFPDGNRGQRHSSMVMNMETNAQPKPPREKATPSATVRIVDVTKKGRGFTITGVE